MLKDSWYICVHIIFTAVCRDGCCGTRQVYTRNIPTHSFGLGTNFAHRLTLTYTDFANKSIYYFGGNKVLTLQMEENKSIMQRLRVGESRNERSDLIPCNTAGITADSGCMRSTTFLRKWFWHAYSCGQPKSTCFGDLILALEKNAPKGLKLQKWTLLM